VPIIRTMTKSVKSTNKKKIITKKSSTVVPLPQAKRKATAKSKRSISQSEKKLVNLSVPPYRFYDAGESELCRFRAVVDLIRDKKHILVLCGAGLSVSCGIPDFRSKTGLYSTLDPQELGLHAAEDLFDLEVFQDNPGPFYKFAQHHFVSSARKQINPSFSHKFLAMMHQHNQLLRVYTQNIDGLEEVAGIPAKSVVYAHGSLAWAQCMRCKAKVDCQSIAEEMEQGIVPLCRNLAKQRKRKSTSSVASSLSTTVSEAPSRPSSPQDTKTISRMRRSCSTASFISDISLTENSFSNINEIGQCKGVMKPGITFFGEKLNCNVARLLEADRKKADAVLVMGTSLSVAPMSKVVKYLSPAIPRILINRTCITPPMQQEDYTFSEEVSDEDFRVNYIFDAYLLGDCDSVTSSISDELGWGTLAPPSDKHESKSKKNRKGSSKYKAPFNCMVVSNDSPLAKQEIAQRTLLFQGAVVEVNDDGNHEVEANEVVHCDGCGHEIVGKIMKCNQCFDFDVCQQCFPKLSKNHFSGSHTFSKERSIIL